MTNDAGRWESEVLLALRTCPLRGERPLLPWGTDAQLQSTLNEILRSAKGSSDSGPRPIRVAMFGEVKSGKSSLINRLVGTPVSPVGVLETTAWEICVSHGPLASAVLHYPDGRSESVPLESLAEVLSMRRPSRVDVTLPCRAATVPGIEFVDTPGLATSTVENQDLSQRLASTIDVVLWVQDANHLGATDVGNELDIVAGTGRTTWFIVNKIDTIDPERREAVRRYMQVHYTSVYGGELFLVSATQGTQQDEFQRLVDALNSKIAARQVKVRADSCRRAIGASLAHELVVVEEVVRSAATAIAQDEFHRRDLDDLRNMLVARGEFLLEEKIRTRLFQGELEEARRHLLTQKLTSRETIVSVQGLFSENRAREQWRTAVTESVAEVEELMRARFREMAARIETAAGESKFRDEERFRSLAASLPAEGALAESLKGSAFVAGAAAVGLAAYAAWLGPAAAYVGFGTALGALVPPLLIAGLAAGVAKAFYSASSRRQEVISRLEAGVESARTALAAEARGRFRESLDAAVRSALEGLSVAFQDRAFRGMPRAKFEINLDSIRTYAATLRGLLASSPFPGVVDVRTLAARSASSP